MRGVISFFRRLWVFIDDRTEAIATLRSFLTHAVPPNIGWPYVLGSATLLAFVMQVVTGIALATAYIASPDQAYDSLQFITHELRFGNMLRGMHFYGASAMFVLISLHAIRTFLYGSYKFPREVNWISGVVLLVLTFIMAWTGQLLRWGETGVWTVVAGAYTASRFPLIGEYIAQFMLAGSTVGEATLSRFFIFHVLFLPLLSIAIIAFHIHLVLRHGVSEPPEPDRPVEPISYRPWYKKMLEERGVPFWPNAAWRDAVFGTGVVAVVILLALIFGAVELGQPPDPSRVQVNPQPDWYFWWYDAMVTLAPPQLEYTTSLLVPLLGFLLLCLLPLVANRGERSPRQRPWAVMTVALVVALFGWLTYSSRQPHLVPDFSVEPLPAEVVGVDSGPIAEGAQLFYDKACLYCHDIASYGGRLGPDLTYVGDRLHPLRMQEIIFVGARNMPSYLDALTVEEMEHLMAFLESRRRGE